MLIVEQGKVVEVCAEPGEFAYDTDTEPTIFSGEPGREHRDRCSRTSASASPSAARPPKDQRVYYFNTKELIGNKYGTPSRCRSAWWTSAPASTSTSPSAASASTATASRTRCCSTRTSAAMWKRYTRDRRRPAQDRAADRAAARICPKIATWASATPPCPATRWSWPTRSTRCSRAKWRNLRGIEIVSFGVSSVKASEEDEQMIKELQRNAAFMDPTRAAAHLGGAQAAAMQAAAPTGRGSRNGFHGHEHGGNVGGMNAQNLYQMGAQQHSRPARPQHAAQRLDVPAVSGITGKFCPNCGSKKPSRSQRPEAGSARSAARRQPESSARNAAQKSRKRRQTAGRAAAAQ